MEIGTAWNIIAHGMVDFSEQTSEGLPVLPRTAPVVELAVANGTAAGQSVPLHRPITILGTRRGCKVRFRDAEVSSLHCALINTGHKVYLRDLLSRSGTYLNDLRADHELLDDGDMIRIGPWEFRISVRTASSQDLDDYSGVNLEPAPAAVGIERSDTRTLVRLPREVNLLGRKNGCDLVLNDRHVSRLHAVIFEYLGHPAIADLLSENGVTLGDRRVSFSTLDAGTEIEIGPYQLIVHLAQPMAHVRPKPTATESPS